MVYFFYLNLFYVCVHKTFFNNGQIFFRHVEHGSKCMGDISSLFQGSSSGQCYLNTKTEVKATFEFVTRLKATLSFNLIT